MSAEFDHNALWMKSRLFVNRVLDAENRSDDERALWASMSFELLAKAALSKSSPLLIADIGVDGRHLLAAAGLLEDDLPFNTIATKTVIARCAIAFPRLDKKRAERLAADRNAYVHSGALGYELPLHRNWWPEYWTLMSVLVDAYGKDLVELVGADSATEVEAMLTRNLKYIEDRTQTLISMAMKRYASSKNGEIAPRDRKRWKNQNQLSLGLSYFDESICPACKECGRLEAEQVESLNVADLEWIDFGDGVFEPTGMVTAIALPDYFSCENCQLVLDGAQYLEAAGIGDGFEVQLPDHDVQSVLQETEYGND